MGSKKDNYEEASIRKLLHYFPPDVEKIRNNLLTFGIPYQLTEGSEVNYYCTKLVGEILKLYEVKNLNFVNVESVDESFKRAYQLKEEGKNVLDLQQLNCYVDFPESRHLFEEGIPERARYHWTDHYAVEKWGIEPYEDILRSIVGLPRKMGVLPPLEPSIRIEKRTGVVLFPHCDNYNQQLFCWKGFIKKLLKVTDNLSIVGKREALDQLSIGHKELWEEAGSGQDLVKMISGADLCIGGATGLSHLAAELEVPTFIIWKYGDYEVFKPLKEHFTRIFFSYNEPLDNIFKKVLMMVRRSRAC